MSRVPTPARESSLMGLKAFGRQPLTPEQQLDALKRVQSQADQRVKLGMQLFKAAEARLSNQHDMVKQIKTLQKQLREQVNEDVARSLHAYDQWIGQIDESFTTAIRKLEEKIDAVQANMTKSETRIQGMLQRAEALLDQSRCLTDQSSHHKPVGEAKPQVQQVQPVQLPQLQPQPQTQPQAQRQAKAKPPADKPQKQAASPDVSQAKAPAPQVSDITPAPPAPPTPPAQPPSANAKTDLKHEPHGNKDRQDKIYSTLLRRLMDDESEGESDQAGDNANAA